MDSPNLEWCFSGLSYVISLFAATVCWRVVHDVWRVNVTYDQGSIELNEMSIFLFRCQREVKDILKGS